MKQFPLSVLLLFAFAEGAEAGVRLQRRVHTTTIYKFRLLALEQAGLKEFGVLWRAEDVTHTPKLQKQNLRSLNFLSAVCIILYTKKTWNMRGGEKDLKFFKSLSLATTKDESGTKFKVKRLLFGRMVLHLGLCLCLVSEFNIWHLPTYTHQANKNRGPLK